MRRSRASLLVAVGTMMGLVAHGPLGAQIVPSPYEFIDARHDVEIYGGVALEDRGSLDLGPGGGPVFGARYGLHVTGPVSVEGNGYLIFTDRQVWDPRPANAPVLLGEADMVLGVVDGRVRFTLTGDRTWRGLAPHATAGIGMAVDFSGRSALEEEASLFSPNRFSFGPAFMATIGAGTRWLPFERLGFRLDTSLNLWRLGNPPAFRELEDELGRPVSENEWASVGTITLGASYRF